MKKLITLMFLLLVTSAAHASVLKVCVAQANEICKELAADDYMKCHNTQMDFCLDELNGVNYKSNPACVEECSMVADDAQRALCYTTCSPL